MPLMKQKQTEWVPESDADIQRVQKQIGRLLRQRYPSFPPKILEEQIIPNAFSDGYMDYLTAVQGPEDLEIDDHEKYMVVFCFNHGSTLVRSMARLHKREEMLPLMDESTEEKASTRSMETVMGDELGAIEKSSPASKLFHNERRDALLSTVGTLTPKERDAFVRVVVHGEKQVDVAKNIKIGIKVFERRLRHAIAKVAWGVAQTSTEAMCDQYQELVAVMGSPVAPTRAERETMLKHVTACSDCRDAVYDTPFAIDVGALLATGLFTTKADPSLVEKVSSSPMVNGPVELAHNVANRLTPGGGHAGEAAAGAGGASAGGAGGTALLVGGGKMAAILCAGAATGVCALGAATGVIPLTQAKSDKSGQNDKPPIERTIPASAITQSPDQTVTTTEVAEKQAAKHQAAKKAQKKQAKEEAAAKHEKAKAAAAAEAKAQEQLSYTSPTSAAAPTTQAETNTSSAASSMGIAPSSGSSSPPPAPAPAPAQVQTNKSSADASMGCC